MAEKKQPEVKINKWDASALKNSLDDSVKDVLIGQYKYTENFSVIDGRLMICTLAVGLAGFALGWDYFYPFPKSRPVLIVCVLGYFILMGILTLYSKYIEKGIFCIAKERARGGLGPDIVWKGSSSLKRIFFEVVLTPVPLVLELYYVSFSSLIQAEMVSTMTNVAKVFMISYIKMSFCWLNCDWRGI